MKPHGAKQKVASGEVPTSLPASDHGRWAAMTPHQRSRAAARLDAFERWQSGELPIDQAVVASGLSRSRFYRVAAEWRAAPSLASLGAFAGTGAARSRLDPDKVNALQAVVAKVVALNAGASVSRLVQLMIDASGLDSAKLPGAISLRSIVETEQRRIATTGEAGNAVQFDCTAVNLPQERGRPWIMFACVDPGTGAVLGAGVTEDAYTGNYSLAARDALSRIRKGLPGLPWATRLARIEITAGVDGDAAARLRQRLLDGGVPGSIQVASAEKRFGRYFRKVVGDRIGRVAITPGRTEKGVAMPDGGDMEAWSESDATAVLAGAVDAYNQDILARLDVKATSRPPEDLVKALILISGD